MKVISRKILPINSPEVRINPSGKLDEPLMVSFDKAVTDPSCIVIDPTNFTTPTIPCCLILEIKQKRMRKGKIYVFYNLLDY